MTGRRLYFTDFLVPLGTLKSAPVVLPVALEDNQLDSVHITVPDGHNGTTGLAIQWSTGAFFPLNQGQFLIANGQEIDFPYGAEVTESGLRLVGFNTDVFDHSFHLRWQMSDLPASSSPVVIASPQLAAASLADISAVQQLAGLDDSGSGDLAALQLAGALS